MMIVQWALSCGLMEWCTVQCKNKEKQQKEFHICKQAELCEIFKDKFSRVRSCKFRFSVEQAGSKTPSKSF